MTVDQANDAGYIAQTTTVEKDPYKATTSYVAKALYNEMGSRVFLRATAFDDQEAEDPSVMQLYFGLRNNGWMFPHSVYIAGDRYDVTKIGSDVNCASYGCTNYEDVGLSITGEQLEAWSKTGVSLKVAGKAGEQVFTINPGYISGFRSVVYGLPAPEVQIPEDATVSSVQPTG